MKKVISGFNVQAKCPNCQGAVTSFEFMQSGKEFGSIISGHSSIRVMDDKYDQTHYKLLRCASCGRGGFVYLYHNRNSKKSYINEFFPMSIDYINVPQNTPKELQSEFKEAEKCISFGAYRAASALFRSTLEKVLKNNGYDDRKDNLQKRIDKACLDGIITESRKQRAHDEIRVLGNDVLHEDWKPISLDDVEASHRYTQRIIEDFYDERESVEKILTTKGRIVAKTEDENNQEETS